MLCLPSSSHHLDSQNSSIPASGTPNDIPLCWVIPQQLFDEVDVREHHAPTAVAREAEFVHPISKDNHISHVLREIVGW